MQSSKLLTALAFMGGLVCAPAFADAPRRVVSMNLCTDQLAMLVAAPGQLYSVSHIAVDPLSSAMAEQARGLPSNRGGAEEIYLMRPDLVVAGQYSAPATLSMLERLGVPVVIFTQTNTLAEVADRIAQMGQVLGQPTRAAEIVTDFNAGLAALQAQTGANPRAALYYANGYTSGDQGLAGQILQAAGFANVAVEAGYPHGGVMPLEVLALAAPDAVITSRPYPGGSRAEEVLDHPVVQTLRQRSATAAFTDSDWVCGTPFVLRAIRDTAALRNVLVAP
jgi:iron complex transport system substrate-binding protein